jgi:hypothetical protein
MNDGLAFPFAVALAVAAMGVDTTVSIMPRPQLSDAFEVRSVTAERAGDTAILKVDRTIKRPINMQFSVRVMQKGPNGWIDTCAMTSGVIQYRPDAALPDPVTLDWWTWGECPHLPAGQSRIVTTWVPEPREMEPLTIIAEVME